MNAPLVTTTKPRVARREPQAILDRYWQALNVSGCERSRQALIEHYLYLVKKTRERSIPTVPVKLTPEDLEQVGYIALIRAVDQYDPKRQIKFESFAITTIRGAMLEYLRCEDWVPRSVRTKQKRLQWAWEKLSFGNGKVVTDDELANLLEISLDGYYQLVGEATIRQVVSLDDAMLNSEHGDSDELLLGESIDSEAPDPQSLAEIELRKAILSQGIDWLPKIEQTVISLYYLVGLKQVEIARLIGKSESRVHQLHAQAMRRLRGFIVGQLAPETEVDKSVIPIDERSTILTGQYVTVTLPWRTKRMSSQSSDLQPPSKQPAVAPVCGPPQSFGTAIIAFYLTTQGKSVALKSDELMRAHRPNSRDLGVDLKGLANEGMLMEVGVGSGFYKRGGHYLMVCSQPAGTKTSKIEILPSIFPGLMIEYGKPYNLVTMVVHLKRGQSVSRQPTDITASSPALLPTNQPVPRSLEVAPIQPLPRPANNVRIVSLPPAQLSVLLAIWPKIPADRPEPFNVSLALKAAGFKPSNVFGCLPPLEVAGFFSRPVKGSYLRGPTTQFRCGHGKVKSKEVSILPRLYPNLRFVVGQVYDVAQVVATLADQPAFAEVAVSPLGSEPELATIQPNGKADKAISELAMIQSTVVSLPVRPSRQSLAGASLDEGIAIRQDHLSKLSAFQARLEEMLQLVFSCRAETEEDIKTLEAAKLVMAKPLPDPKA